MGKRFLLIDDDSDDRALFSEALALVDPVIVCEQAADGEEAFMRLLQSNGSGEPDMIFLDINLPIMSGWQFLSQLKKEDAYKDIPVIVYSTSSNEKDKDTARDLGALCFITKPHAFRVLKDVLGVVVTCMKNHRIKTLCNEVYAIAAKA